jgi:hypothetical protein
MEYMSQHPYHSSGDVVATQTNVTSFSADFLCQPGELEPWWAKLIILGTLVAFIGVITALMRDVRIWIRKVKI